MGFLIPMKYGTIISKNYIHIVFSTKNRKPLISPSIENKLYAYIGGICRELECNPVAIGGHNDHIHIFMPFI